MSWRHFDFQEAGVTFVMWCAGIMALCAAAILLRMAITGEGLKRSTNTQQQVEVRIK